MSSPPLATAQEALLRVLINGESDGPDIVRKVRDWTEGQIGLDEQGLAAVIADLERTGLVERRTGPADKRTGQPRELFALTAAGKAAALEVLAASLTREA
jgi:DNA-binding PadR family transcriptional regulator